MSNRHSTVGVCTRMAEYRQHDSGEHVHSNSRTDVTCIGHKTATLQNGHSELQLIILQETGHPGQQPTPLGMSGYPWGFRCATVPVMHPTQP